MQAVLLAGGLGTRLRSVVSDRPKPMALVDGKPFMEYVIMQLKNTGSARLFSPWGTRAAWWRSILRTGGSWE